MSDSVRRSAVREASADGGSLLATMRGLWPYIWPSDRRDLQLRVMSPCCCSPLATIAVPFTFVGDRRPGGGRRAGCTVVVAGLGVLAPIR
jgi:hypothetical protein